MFDDFRRDDSRARKRFAGTLVVAATLYAGASAALIAASAEARQRVEEVLTQVEFVRGKLPAPPPPPPPPEPPKVAEPPPPPPEPPKPIARRPRVKRPPLVAPQEVPKEKPPESDDALVDAAPPAPQDGFLDGAPGGTGIAPAPRIAPPPPPAVKVVAPPPPPKPPPAKLIAPVAIDTDRPKYPARLRRMGIEGAVVVAFDVLDDGRVANARIVSGPSELHETVLEAVATWRFRPARRGDQRVRHRVQHTIRFRLDG